MPLKVNPWRDIFADIASGASAQSVIDAAAVGFIEGIFAGPPPRAARVSADRPRGGPRRVRVRRPEADMSWAWELFGLPPAASEPEFKARFRELALQSHPDRPGGSAAKFRRVTDAWEHIRRFKGW